MTLIELSPEFINQFQGYKVREIEQAMEDIKLLLIIKTLTREIQVDPLILEINNPPSGRGLQENLLHEALFEIRARDHELKTLYMDDKKCPFDNRFDIQYHRNNNKFRNKK